MDWLELSLRDPDHRHHYSTSWKNQVLQRSSSQLRDTTLSEIWKQRVQRGFQIYCSVWRPSINALVLALCPGSRMCQLHIFFLFPESTPLRFFGMGRDSHFTAVDRAFSILSVFPSPCHQVRMVQMISELLCGSAMLNALCLGSYITWLSFSFPRLLSLFPQDAIPFRFQVLLPWLFYLYF